MRAAQVRQLAAAWTMAEEAVRRCADFVLAFALFVVLSPLIALRAIHAKAKTGNAFDRVQSVGRFRIPFERLYFAGPGAGRELAVLFNLLKGEM